MNKSIREIIAKRLDALMKANDDLGSQQKLAAKTGIGQTTIGRIRRGEVNATADNLQAIADALKVPVSYLFGENLQELKGGEASRSENAPPAQMTVSTGRVAELVRVFCQTDDIGRETIDVAIGIAKNRISPPAANDQFQEGGGN